MKPFKFIIILFHEFLCLSPSYLLRYGLPQKLKVVKGVDGCGQVIIAQGGGVWGLTMSLLSEVLNEELCSFGYEVQAFLRNCLHIRTALHDHFDPLCGQHEVRWLSTEPSRLPWTLAGGGLGWGCHFCFQPLY